MAMQGFKYTLSWTNDFTEVDNAPANFSDRSAQTKATVTLDPKLTAKRDTKESDYYFAPATVNVIVKASKTESWVVKDLKSDNLLKHEQLHYNISALAGRDLERKILALKDPSGPELIKKRDALASDTQTLITSVNKDYDDSNTGTKHGANAGVQSKWELHINNLMSKPEAELKGV